MSVGVECRVADRRRSYGYYQGISIIWGNESHISVPSSFSGPGNADWPSGSGDEMPARPASPGRVCIRCDACRPALAGMPPTKFRADARSAAWEMKSSLRARENVGKSPRAEAGADRGPVSGPFDEATGHGAREPKPRCLAPDVACCALPILA